MKKILLLMVILSVFVLSLPAADFLLGPKIGLGDYNYYGYDWNSYKNYYDIKNKFTVSFSGGLFFNSRFSDLFSLQIEALYSYRSFRYGDVNWFQENYNAITFPIYARFDFDTGKVKPFLMVGPRLGFVFNEFTIKHSSGGTIDAIMLGANNFMFGFSLGGGFSFPAGSGKFDAGIVYNNTFTQIFTDWRTYSQGFEIQLGYGFAL